MKTTLAWRGVTALLLTLAICALTNRADAVPSELKVSADGHFLVKRADGSPFYWNCDTGWGIFQYILREDAAIYLRDRKSKGFNGFLGSLVFHFGNTPNFYGDKAWDDDDARTPNEAYFKNVDIVLDNARRASCQSNLKQIGLGILQYVQDYDELYPTADDNNSGAQFGGSLITGVGQYGQPTSNELKYGRWRMAIMPYTKSSQLYADPSSHSNSPNARYNNPGGGTTDMPSVFNYGVNAYILVSGGTGPLSIAAVQQAALIPMVADSGPMVFNYYFNRVFNANHRENPNGFCSTTGGTGAIDESSARHLNGSNLLFCDGHVKFYPQAALVVDPARASYSFPNKWKIPLRPTDDRVQ